MGIEGAAVAGWMSEALSAAGTAVATGAVVNALAPNAPPVPEVKGPLAMPDPLAQEVARKKMITDTMQRRGRASTIITDTGTGKLGG